MTKLQELQQRLNFTFSDATIADEALTHSSYVNEAAFTVSSNERLAHLGDAVLELIVRHQLYHDDAEAKKGDLSEAADKLVNNEQLALIAESFELANYMKFGHGEPPRRSRVKVLAQSTEALLAAEYLHNGLAGAQSVWKAMLAAPAA